jgi:DDE superfamily endonuclease
MLTETLDFVKLYIELLNNSLMAMNGKLSRTQQIWLGFCLTAIILTNSVCWKAWERWSGGCYRDSALSWMLRHSTMPWSLLLIASTNLILKRYGIKQGVLVIDDSDHERSKNTNKIGYVHKIKDKKTEGYYQGQNLVFLILVTDIITLPVGFGFYEPDPVNKAWEKEDKRLRKAGVKKKNRPFKPQKNKKYPTKLEMALNLLSQFFQACHEIKIRCIVADAFYGSADFVEQASKLNNGIQMISQIRSNQLVRNKRGLLVEVKGHFKDKKPIKRKVCIRGGIQRQLGWQVSDN